mgnify:CR=1 FL=1
MEIYPRLPESVKCWIFKMGEKMLFFNGGLYVKTGTNNFSSALSVLAADSF